MLGIFIALLTSFFWYAFFYVMRELMRIYFYLTIYYYHSTYYELLILTDEEVFFYNFVFALIASIFGLSASFQFWFHRAKRFNENSMEYFRKSSIYTDATGLNAIFLHWFARAAFFFAVYAGIEHTWCYFQLYPGWIFFWVLLIVVLFMEMWKTIRKVAFRESRRWILFSAVGIIVWSFLLSNIQIVDYHGVNNVYLNSSVTRKYQMQYPKSDYYRVIENRSLIVDIHLCFPSGVTMDSLPKVFVNQKESGFEFFHDKIEEALQNYYEMDKRLVTAVLHIDRQMPMKYVKMLQKYLSCNDLRRIGYRIFPDDQRECAVTHFAILRQLPPCPDSYIAKKNPQWFNIDGYEKIFIKLTPAGLYVDKESKNWSDINDAVRKFVSQHSNYLVVLDIDEHCVYDDYAKMWGTLFKIFSELRNEESILLYNKQIDELSGEQQDEIINQRLPSRIYELATGGTQR